MNPDSKLTFPERRSGMIGGAFAADALAMPVHWYYDRQALQRDYGRVTDFLAPRNPHPDSILWRSSFTPVNEQADILHDQAQYWGRRGIHYHQFLRAGENTLNLQLGLELLHSLDQRGGYDAADYLRRYVEFMRTPGRHRDTYVEECHRHFFNQLARGRHPGKCSANDIHIGGLAHVPVLVAWLADDRTRARTVVREHVALTHHAPETLAAADALTLMLLDVMAARPVREAILEHGRDWYSARKARDWSREPDERVIGERLSTACYIADAFPASLHLAWKYAGDSEAGLIANTNVGGDNCHRGVVVGALLGGADGIEALPLRWRTGLLAGEALTRLLHRRCSPT